MHPRRKQCHSKSYLQLAAFLNAQEKLNENEFHQMVHSGTQMTSINEEYENDLESQLRHVKEQLKSAQIHIEFLSERMKTYRYRWLEQYYCADNLEHHMLDGVYVPKLDQIPESATSPSFFPELLSWSLEGSDWREHSTDL
ncbi:uncharacterized protein HD556DRAFT_1310746 [Suillus plorans]|uniref:Uncharacterized protein n=1 Tax=Suillus plorans TaxID=116603 RepID=A0A9P7AIV7_9AGAM|nr:uncharacterized protein HD556DRAFT_1310746 [Suillus plorans]KAG1790358.1 hypothetical protein HD556DRAFT_1310746 [Suillus plorans]